jgi:hypothetical protein
MAVPRLAFVTLSKRNVSAVSVGASAERRNAHIRREGVMLAAMARTRSAAATSPSRNGIVGVKSKFGKSVAATDNQGYFLQ